MKARYSGVRTTLRKKAEHEVESMNEAISQSLESVLDEMSEANDKLDPNLSESEYVEELSRS